MKSSNTGIHWITCPDTGVCEWITYRKTFDLDCDIAHAVIRFESDCTCAVTVNGTFITSGNGRYPERVSCHEVTSKLHPGSNTVEMILGGHYFQKFAFAVKEQRGYWLNQAALRLDITDGNGSHHTVTTDASWEIPDSDKTPIITMQVTNAEYETMWEHAALWSETDACTPELPAAVRAVAGDAYMAYANRKQPVTQPCEKTVSTDMHLCSDAYHAPLGAKHCQIIFDMERLYVGFVEFFYRCTDEITVELRFDFTESPADFEDGAKFASTIERLCVTEVLSPDSVFFRNLRRRAFRFMKLDFYGDLSDFCISVPCVRLCMFPVKAQGWFDCADERLSRAWEMGKYTLHVNKQQEYESCPRREMLFFAGDGAIDAQIDRYAFGSCDMLEASLAIRHEINATGISPTPHFNRVVWQWDYFAWRIICIDLYYRQTGDTAFLKRHYSDAVTNLLWLTERMNDRHLLFQIPAYHSTFASTMIQVDWACSIHRLGENAFLNCLLYQSLACMSRLASVMGDDTHAKEWVSLAEQVREAINTHLWDEEKQAYHDGLSDYIAQDANTLAVLFGVADEARTQAALDTVKRTLWTEYGTAMADTRLNSGDLRHGNETVSPMMSALEAEAHFLRGRPEDGLEVIRRVWGTMLDKGATTFWEFSPANDTDRWDAPCHAWSAGCTYLLSAYILGLQFVPDDRTTILFTPNPCDLAWGRGVLPTENGLIAASFVLENGIYRCRIALPQCMELKTCLPENAELEIIRYETEKQNGSE